MLAVEKEAGAVQGAFHPADLLGSVTPGNPLVPALRSRLPLDYSVPDARIFGFDKQ